MNDTHEHVDWFADHIEKIKVDTEENKIRRASWKFYINFNQHYRALTMGDHCD